jgi:hypothetical protein
MKKMIHPREREEKLTSVSFLNTIVLCSLDVKLEVLGETQ